MNTIKSNSDLTLIQKKRTTGNKLLNFFFGAKDTTNYEQKIFIAASLIGAFTSLIGVIWNSGLGLSFVPVFLLYIILGGYLILFYYARFRNTFNSVIFIFITLLGLSFLYFIKDGLNGSLPAVYIIVLATFLSISKLKYHLIILLVTMANLALLIAAEYSFANNLVIHYNDNGTRLKDLAFGYIANLVVCYFIFRYFKKVLILKNNELEKLNNSKTLLFNIIAHDLKSPFGGILGLTNMMSNKSKKYTAEEYQEFAGEINKSSERAYELLESLLVWGKIQMDETQYDPKAIQLNQLTNEALKLYAPKFSRKKIEVVVQVEDDISVFVDINIFLTIIRNLVSNALKFTPSGGKVSISAEEYDSEYITMVVSDSGIGMDSKMIKNLFHSDVDTNREGTEGEKSNGLGLVICKELIEKQGCCLRIESKVNKGSTFKFKVPKALEKHS